MVVKEVVQRSMVRFCDHGICKSHAKNRCKVCKKDLCETHTRHIYLPWDSELGQSHDLCIACDSLISPVLADVIEQMKEINKKLEGKQ